MSRLSTEILAGLGSGRESVDAGGRLALAMRQMQQAEAARNEQLFRERAARTYNMRKYEELSGPQTPGSMGGASQSMDVFANLPLDMQGKAVAEMEDRGRRQENMQIVKPVLDSLRRDGLEAEAADIEYRVKNDIPIPQWSGAFKLKKKGEENFDPGAFSGSLPGLGWSPEQASMLGRFAQTTGQRPTGSMVEKAWEQGQPPKPKEQGTWGADQLVRMLPGLKATAPDWVERLNRGDASFNDAQQAASRVGGGAGRSQFVEVDAEQQSDSAPTAKRFRVPYGNGQAMPPNIRTIFRQIAESLTLPIGEDIARDGVFYDTQQTPESFAATVDKKMAEMATAAGWAASGGPLSPPAQPSSSGAPASGGRGTVDQQVEKLIDMGITDRARIKKIIKGEEAWPEP